MYHEEYTYRHLSDWTSINDASSRSGPQYDKHGREVLELGLYYDSELDSPTPHVKEEDDIDARLAVLDQKLIVHSLRIMTLESSKDDNKKMEEGEPQHLPQHTYVGNKGKHDLFDEWMDSIEHLDAVVTNKSTDMKVDEEATYYMDEDLAVMSCVR